MTQQRIGRYAVLDEIAAGAQGTVYRAHDPESGRIIALKVLHRELSRDPQYVERFRREATLAASVDHPNIVRIFEVGEADGLLFMAVELLPESLARIIQAGPLPLRAAAEYGAQMAAGLGAAHAAGIVHRDIKPQNVLIDADGTAKVTDFGIARGESLTTMTATGVMMGTPHYMAPELAEGERATERSDIYALGCVLYQMLAGEVPFAGTTPMVVLRRHIDDEPEPIRERRDDVPRALADVVACAMAKNPADRFASAAEMAAAIREAAGLPEVREAPPITPLPVPAREEPAGLYDTPLMPPLPRKRGWWKWSLAVGFTAAVAAVVLTLWLLQPWAGTPAPAKPLEVALAPPIATAIPTSLPTPIPSGAPTAVPTALPVSSVSSEGTIFRPVDGSPDMLAATFPQEARSEHTFVEVVLTGLDSAGGVDVRVDVQAVAPAQAPAPLDVPVYAYVSATLLGVAEPHLTAGTIKFEVSDAWLRAGGFTPADVALYRLSYGAWNALPTQYVAEALSGTEETALMRWFEAATPGFSVFAVGAERATPVPTATPTPTPTRAPTATPTATPRPTATPSPAPRPTATPTPTLAPTATSTPRPTATPWPTASPTPDPRVVPTPVPFPTPVPTPTPVRTPTPRPTATPTRTPTPRPTATTMPTPTPVSLAFGPVDGTLAHDPNTGTIKTRSAGVDLTDIVVEAEFFNPYSTATGSWDYGFQFRKTGTQKDMVSVRSDGRWFHYSDIGTGEEPWELLNSGSLPWGVLDTSTRGSNRLKLVAIGRNGWLFVNGHHVMTLQLGTPAESGDVAVVTGCHEGDEVAGASTVYEGFTATPLSKLIGPLDGEMVQAEGSIAGYRSGVRTGKDVVAEARFFNPYPTSEGTWSYGFLLWNRDFNVFDTVFVRSNRNWYHYTSTGSSEDRVELASGYWGDTDTEARGSNRLLVMVSGEEGWLFVNDTFVTGLDFGGADKEGPVNPMSGYFTDDEHPGAVIPFEDFTMWSP